MPLPTDDCETKSYRARVSYEKAKIVRSMNQAAAQLPIAYGGTQRPILATFAGRRRASQTSGSTKPIKASWPISTPILNRNRHRGTEPVGMPIFVSAL